MTMKQAQLFFFACLLFAAGTAFYGYKSLDWSSVRFTTASDRAVAVPTPDVPVELRATLTALARPTSVATPTSSPPPLSGAGVTINGALYRVDAISDPDLEGFWKPPEGKRLVAVHVTIRAGDAPVQYSFNQFRLADTSGADFTWGFTNSEPKFDQGNLAVGQTYSGWIAFAVAIGSKPGTVLVQPRAGGPKIPIVALP